MGWLDYGSGVNRKQEEMLGFLSRAGEIFGGDPVPPGVSQDGEAPITERWIFRLGKPNRDLAGGVSALFTASIPHGTQLLPANPRLREFLLHLGASRLVRVDDPSGDQVVVCHPVHIRDDSAWVTNQHNLHPMPGGC
jgi:hypothetical protein